MTGTSPKRERAAQWRPVPCQLVPTRGLELVTLLEPVQKLRDDDRGELMSHERHAII